MCVIRIQLRWVFTCVIYSIRKGVGIKSYLISYALIWSGFKMWKQIDLYIFCVETRITYCKCVSLYKVYRSIYLIRILCVVKRCVKTASTRCVFKIYNLTRLKLHFMWLSCVWILFRDVFVAHCMGSHLGPLRWMSFLSSCRGSQRWL